MCSTYVQYVNITNVQYVINLTYLFTADSSDECANWCKGLDILIENAKTASHIVQVER